MEVFGNTDSARKVFGNTDSARKVFGNTDSARNHENYHQLLVHFMTHTQHIVMAHSSWREETRYCSDFSIFCKKQQVYFSALAFILPMPFYFLAMSISDFP